MTLADLIAVAGGLTEGAYKYSSEVSRTDFSDPERASTVSISVALGDNAGGNFVLSPLDNALFKTVPEYRDQSVITLAGEVKFPGEYPFARGETLTSVIERAGGFTDLAFAQGAIFTREALKTRERQELERLEEKLAEEMQAEQLRSANSDIQVDAEADRLRQEALDQLGSTEAVGRLVIPLQNMVDGIADDLVLEDGDALSIPGFRQEVSILGEVQQPTSYLYSRGLAVQDYIDLSGGFLKTADKQGVYLVKASGQVIMPKRSLFRFGSKNAVVEPGDTIVVPLDTDDKKLSGIALLTEVSQIIYQLSLGAAAINSLNK
jgi:protein involved in polysaccharide export with SLBB domain